MALALAAAFVAAPAYADNTLTNIESTDACTLAYAGAVACQGYYGGNIDNATVSFQQTALNELLTSPTAGVAIGGPAPVINWQSLVDNNQLYSAANLVGNSLYFGQTLYGYVVLGAHFGNNSDTTNPPPNVSAFYVFNFCTTGSDHVTSTQCERLLQCRALRGAAAGSGTRDLGDDAGRFRRHRHGHAPQPPSPAADASGLKTSEL